jgi:hypothetical protein
MKKKVLKIREILLDGTVRYRISYTISSTNTFLGTGIVRLKVKDMVGMCENIDTSFSATIISNPWTYYYGGNILLENDGWRPVHTVAKKANVTEEISLDGILTISCGPDQGGYWSFVKDDSRLTYPPLTYEFKMRFDKGVSAGGGYIGFRVGIDIRIFKDKVMLIPPSYYTQTYYMDTTDNFHTYRITATDSWINLYIDGVLRLSVSGSWTYEFPGSISIYGVPGLEGSLTHWDYIAYYAGAAYAPDVFPLGSSKENAATTVSNSAYESTIKVPMADSTFILGEVYSFPNPANNGKNPTIHIECGIADKVELKIYNIAAELVHETTITEPPSVINWKYAYEYTWDISNIPSGVYIYVIQAIKSKEKDIIVTKKLAIIK